MNTQIPITIRGGWRPFLSLLVWCLSLGFAAAATSVSQFGITWYFSEDRQVGQFANGDWWVVGPVTITAISPADPTPADTVDIHGTMINPLPATKSPYKGIHGWDSRIRDNTYNPSLNIAKSLPYTVPGGSSVMSCKSVVTAVSGNNLQMDTVAVLTVLASAPAPGSFRPPYIGTDKRVRWNVSQLDYSKLRKYAPVPYTPTFASVEPFFERAHIGLTPLWVGTYLHTVTGDNPGYGREISHKANAGALLLNLNYSNAQKERLLIRMVQRGIDIYGVRAAGSGWFDEAGHNNGRKIYLMLAGWVLNDPAILALGGGFFSEDRMHFYVSQADVDRPRKTGKVPYTTAMIGMPEWGGKHAGEPEGDSSAWNAPYRDNCGASVIGSILTARIMGMEKAWNHPATFDYIDRFYSIEKNNVSTDVNKIQPFVSEMWKAYRNGGTNSGTVPPLQFSVGARIAVTVNTNVRAAGSLSSTLLGVQQAESAGTIVAGPVVADNITWWQVNFDNGVDGWSGADNFMFSNTIPPAVSFAVGGRIAVIRNTNVRATGTLSGTLLGVQTTGSTGTIVAGPVVADNITWWQVNYDNGADGWSGADNFEASTTTAPPTPPTAPTGLRVVGED